MVRQGSIRRHPDGVTIDFVVGDDTRGDDPGPLHAASRPDLFREDSGVIAEGRFQPDGTFVASEILAKHDENYMPPELDRARHAQDGGARLIAEAGLAALWLAAALSLLQLVLGCGGAAAGRRGAAARSCGRSRWRRACSPALAFLALIWLFLRTDLSVKLVAANSHSAEALALQIRRRLGQSRRLDAALGDGARASPAAPSPCSSGGCGRTR